MEPAQGWYKDVRTAKPYNLLELFGPKTVLHKTIAASLVTFA